MATELTVSTDWLAKHLNDPGVRVVDIRGYVVTKPTEPGVEQAEYRGAREEYLAAHIPGAVFIDWTFDIVDLADSVPAQVASPAVFADTMERQGIGDNTHVIAVDHMGGQFATRLWWALSYYGHDAVSVLDGGWNAWLGQEQPVESGNVSVKRAHFTARPRPELRVTAEQVAELLGRSDRDWQLIDARDPGQFTGAASPRSARRAYSRGDQRAA